MSLHFSDLDSVVEFDALNDLWQLVLAVQTAPCFGGGTDEFEHHEFGGLRRQSALCPHGAMTDRREYALDRV